MEDQQNLQNGNQGKPTEQDDSVKAGLEKQTVLTEEAVSNGGLANISSAETDATKVVTEKSGASGGISNNGSPGDVSGDVGQNQIDWQAIEIDKKILDIVSVESLSKFRFIPFEMTDELIKVAVVDESDLNTQNALRFFSRKNKKRLEIYPISIDDFEVLIKKTKKLSLEIGDALDVYEKKEEAAVDSGIKLRKRKEDVRILKDAPIAKMVESLVENAIDAGASDIHIEAMADNIRVRYRIDGDLKTVISLPKKIGPALVSRIKILSNLKIALLA